MWILTACFSGSLKFYSLSAQMHHCIRTSHLEKRGAGLVDQAAAKTHSCLFFLCVCHRDPNPKVERLYASERGDHMLRVQNFSILNRHLRAFYQVCVCVCVLDQIISDGLRVNTLFSPNISQKDETHWFNFQSYYTHAQSFDSWDRICGRKGNKLFNFCLYLKGEFCNNL